MLSSTLKRVAGVTALAGALVAGAVAVPAAAASPADEAAYLVTLKNDWKAYSVKEQRTACSDYRGAPAVTVSATVTSVAAPGWTKAELRRVIAAYLKWACAGAGTPPRSDEGGGRSPTPAHLSNLGLGPTST